MKKPSLLRSGWTTGACAAAAAKAAWLGLNGQGFPDPVEIILPRGERPNFPLARKELRDGEALAGVIKDAGDDPDVTHGAEIIASVRHAPPGSGLIFKAGEGVGRVTRPGLPLTIGEPAINPGPRFIIAANLGMIDAEVAISIPGGEALAAKTLNSRLGILGGLSILGTTGIVRPFSQSAWIQSIHRAVDVARACDCRHLAGVTGRTSESSAKRELGLGETAIIEMGDFVGALLKYLRRRRVEKLTIVGGFAKLAKLAAGELDLHSGKSRVDIARLANWAGADFAKLAGEANTALAVLEMAGEAGVNLGDMVAERALQQALWTLDNGTEIAIRAIDRGGRIIGRAG
jgi:cobalt-precorrin-5B (C1)-methyltransferase